MEKEYPVDFRCPISKELMKDPVTTCTGFTYERKNIEKWLFTCKKKTCPVTMQSLQTFHITPNHTLKQLIHAWIKDHESQSCSSQSMPRSSVKHDELVSLLTTRESSPFKVNILKKLRSIIETGDGTKSDFIRSGGVEVVVQIVHQVLVEYSDFVTFTVCEGALGVLYQLPSSKHDKTIKILSKPESVRSIAIVLQKGLAEVYAEEYVQKTNPTAGPLSFSDEQKKEASTLFKKLCLKLDALSHFHFIPKPVIKDLSIQVKVPALAMEEIAPIAVSDAAMLAPEEVFTGKGEIKEETELTQAERKGSFIIIFFFNYSFFLKKNKK